MTKIADRLALILVGSLALSACGGGNGGSTTAAAPPVQTGQTVDVGPCLAQMVTPTQSVASLVVPDTIRLNMAAASGFPNGRRLQDPVIDVTLAALFLDLKTHGADTFAKIPLDPPGSDKPPLATFPYLASAQGSTPVGGVGSGFVFRTDAPAAYTRVDRMGFPAVATALVRSASKTAYNDDNPAIDATGKWVPEFTEDLKGLTTALADDLKGLNLTPCAKIS